MFSKGSWAILGIKPKSEKAFLATINDPKAAQAISQSHALEALRKDEKLQTATGINPFENPRKDESERALHGGADFGESEQEFRINPKQPWYGFWFVINEAEDVDDIKSKQEQFAYSECSRPFKFLAKDQKKSVEAMAKPHNVGTRKQFPVLLDFETGRVYIESTNKEEILSVLDMLGDMMGVETHALAWDFGDANWVEHFLSKVNEKNKFVKEMASRAADIRRGLDIEPLEDKVMESVVKNFFALAELDSGLWAGLFPNVAIKLYDGGEPVIASTPSDAFNLLSLGDSSVGWGDARISSSGVMLQELDSRFTKSGEEKQVRTNLFSFDLNQNWALSDEGAALVRGFDVPNFKKDILKGIRKSKQEQPVAFFWSEWLRQLNLGVFTLVDNINLTLGTKVKGGLTTAETGKTEEEINA